MILRVSHPLRVAPVALLLAGSLLVACQLEAPAPDLLVFTCGSDADCAPGYLCHTGVCTRVEELLLRDAGGDAAGAPAADSARVDARNLTDAGGMVQ